ncbi:hypothetical protein M407DRAFT_245483 [Tulasnella calospora MUT 4182]|uniref:Heparinase II N-terminal domain-containing protein n=1 Tax=Tulasnella calospora MUT 4182 TaxID=1051891 RepID=A0A0C3QAY4_9AGAM|nr:hypothetical protein M407DRAFT_245483 [Tulasnella calospora MUT 4182]
MAYRESQDHLTNTNYHSVGAEEYGGNYAEPKKGLSKWVKIGIPVGVVIVVAAVVGGIVGSRSSNKSSTSSSASNSGSTGEPNASEVASAKTAIGMFATTTNAHSVPIYPSTTNAAAFTEPTFIAKAGSNAALTWNADTFQPATPAPTTVRPDRPRLIAPAYKWEQLAAFVASDPYMKQWNDTIMADVNQWEGMDPVPYDIDGGLNKSGVLDVARSVKQRIKAFAYAYRVTGQTMWADRAWKELQNASGTGSQPFGTAPDNWNTQHFLDVAEFTAAFAIGYDWLYDVWTDQQKTTIRTAIINLGLNFGIQAYANNAGYGWWRTVNGNWNCVCNGGLTMGALAILGDDTSGVAEQILGYTIDNAKANCAMGPSSDGTWSETPNYWYFGTTAQAEMASSLLTATGSTYGLMTANPTFADTGLYHMYVYGNQQMFDYGDHGPNKFSTTANAMMFQASQFNKPEYMLFQRDRIDAAEPWSMFWYDPSVTGAFWNNMPLDHYFDDPLDVWASMRSSWTDVNGLFVAMKAGNHTGHQTHGDLDAGDFVIDALGVRWAGELGSGDYLSDGYFSSEATDSQRWLYYRTRTEGQNCLVVNHQNQNVNAATPSNFGSSNTAQGSSTVFEDPSDSTAFFTADLTATNNGAAIKRGIRLINGRKQVLLQDDITNVQQPMEWRMHTNATVTTSGASATLTLDGNTMQVQILDPPAGVVFGTAEAVRYADDPALPAGMTDQPNPGVTVLTIELPAGSYNLQVLFNPQWPDMQASDFKTPAMVAIDQWSLTSHN